MYNIDVQRKFMKKTGESVQKKPNHLCVVQRKVFLGFSWIGGGGRRGIVLHNVLLDLRDGASDTLLHLSVTVDAAAHLLLVLVEAVSGDEHRLRRGAGLNPGLGYAAINRFDNDRLFRGHLYKRERHKQIAILRFSLAFDI